MNSRDTQWKPGKKFTAKDLENEKNRKEFLHSCDERLSRMLSYNENSSVSNSGPTFEELSSELDTPPNKEQAEKSMQGIFDAMSSYD